jgi:hypothetical protein
MFRELLCPSSGARDYDGGYHIGRISETHYTQENTTITTHYRSQLLILTETRYQLQHINKEHHTEHTPLRTINLPQR